MPEKKLSDVLREEMELRGITGVECGRLCGLQPTVISRIANDKFVSGATVIKLVEGLGNKFEKYIKYKTCKICGKKFIPNRSSVTCSNECSKANCKDLKNKHNASVKKNKITFQTNAERFDWKVRDLKKPEVPIVKFMNGKQYGDRQREYLISLQKTQRMEIR